jgi:hypothetical protein
VLTVSNVHLYKAFGSRYVVKEIIFPDLRVIERKEMVTSFVVLGYQLVTSFVELGQR